MSSNSRRRKHEELNVLSLIGNEPPPKRKRASPQHRPRLSQPIRADYTEGQISSQPSSRPGKRRRDDLDSEPEEPVNDENKCTDLEECLKRLRIRRPIIFSITSFIEQSVDAVSYTFTDQDAQLDQPSNPANHS